MDFLSAIKPSTFFILFLLFPIDKSHFRFYDIFLSTLYETVIYLRLEVLENIRHFVALTVPWRQQTNSLNINVIYGSFLYEWYQPIATNAIYRKLFSESNIFIFDAQFSEFFHWNKLMTFILFMIVTFIENTHFGLIHFTIENSLQLFSCLSLQFNGFSWVDI